MSCDASVSRDALTPSPFQRQGATGGRVFGSVRITATCEDERVNPQLISDEPTSWWWKWLADKTVYTRNPPVLKEGEEVGSVTIESIWRADADTIGVQLNATTEAYGQQSFCIKVMCRCREGDSWTERCVDVSFQMDKPSP